MDGDFLGDLPHEGTLRAQIARTTDFYFLIIAKIMQSVLNTTTNMPMNVASAGVSTAQIGLNEGHGLAQRGLGHIQRMLRYLNSTIAVLPGGLRVPMWVSVILGMLLMWQGLKMANVVDSDNRRRIAASRRRQRQPAVVKRGVKHLKGLTAK